jgi:hypothetical protein
MPVLDVPTTVAVLMSAILLPGSTICALNSLISEVAGLNGWHSRQCCVTPPPPGTARVPCTAGRAKQGMGVKGHV